MADVVELATRRLVGKAELQTFSDEKDRDRLSPVALKAYRNLAGEWSLANAEAAALIGVSESTWDRIKAGKWDQPLNQDQLTRVSALVGVFKGLRLLFADSMADRWPRLANKGPLFERRSPIEAMIDGGIPAMIDVRRYVDAVRGGL
jgi:hypothetical protein